MNGTYVSRRYFEYEAQPQCPDIYDISPDVDGDLLLSHECSQGCHPDEERPRPIFVRIADGTRKADAVRVLKKVIVRIRKHPGAVMTTFRPEPIEKEDHDGIL